MSTAFILLMICVMILSVILIFLVLSQNPKGGGLSSTFGGGGAQSFGVQNTNQFMDKATWTVTGTIAVIIMFSSIIIAKPSIKNTSESTTPASSTTSAPANKQELPKK